MTTSFVLNSRIDSWEKFKNIYKNIMFKVNLKEPTQNLLQFEIFFLEKILKFAVLNNIILNNYKITKNHKEFPKFNVVE